MNRLITHLGGARVTVGVGVLLIMLGGAERHLGFAVLIANATSHLAVQALKRTIARARPCDASGIALALVALPDPYSFPSGHAAAITAVVATIAFAHPTLAPALAPIGALVVHSRVALRVHHPGDVIAGALLGLSGAVVTTALL